MTQDNPYADYTVRKLVTDALKAFHEGNDEGLDVAWELARQMVWVPHEKAPGIAEFGHKFLYEIDGARARRDGIHQELNEKRAKAYGKWRELAEGAAGTGMGVAMYPGIEQDAQAAEREYLDAKRVFDDVNHGDGFMGSRLFGSTVPRRKVVTSEGFIGGIDADEYLVPEAIADLPLDEVMFDTKGRPKVEFAYRRAMLSNPLQQDEDGTYIEWEGGKEYIDEYLEPFRSDVGKNAIRRARLGLQDGEGFELAPGTLQEAAVRGITNLYSRQVLDFDPEGEVFNVRTAHPAIRYAYAPDLYGDGNKWKSLSALRDPRGLRAALEVEQELFQAGEMGMTMGETAQVAVSQLGDFIGTYSAASGIGRLGLKTARVAVPRNHAMAKMVGGLADKGAKAAGITGAEGRAIRPPGMMFGQAKNVWQEVVYSTIRNGVTGDGSWLEGVAEGVQEGIMEMGASLAFHAFMIPVRKTGAKLSRVAKEHAPGTIPDKLEAMTDWTRVRKEGRLAALSARLKRSPMKDANMRALVQSMELGAVAQEASMQALESSFVGALFGAYQSALSELGPVWEDMNVWQQIGAVRNHMISPEAMGNALAYAGVSLSYGAASLRQARVAPEVADQTIRFAVENYLNPNNVESIAEFTEQAEAMRKANPDLLDDIDIRSRAEVVTAEEEKSYLQEIDKNGPKELTGAMLSERKLNAPGWSPQRVSLKRTKEGVSTEYRMVGEAEASEGRHRIWRKGASPYAVKMVPFPEADTHAYAIVHASDTNKKVERTQLWTSMEGAASQADAILIRQGRGTEFDVSEPQSIEEMRAAEFEELINESYGDPEYASLTPGQIVENRLNGTKLQSPQAVKHVSAEAASEKRAHEILRNLKLVPSKSGVGNDQFKALMARAIDSPQALTETMLQMGATQDQANRVIEDANNAERQRELASLELAGGDEEFARGIQLVFADRRRSLSKEELAEAEALGLLDSDGNRIHPGWQTKLGEWLDRQVEYASPEALAQQRVMLSNRGVSAREGKLPAILGLDLRRAINSIGRTRNPWMAPFRFLVRQIDRARPLGRFASGMHNTEMSALDNFKWISEEAKIDAAAQEFRVEAELILRDLNRPFGPGETAPNSTFEAFYDLIDSGALKRMKSADDVAARYGEHNRHLFDLGQRWIEVANRIGEANVQNGWMDQRQFDKWQSQWIMHSYLRATEKTAYELWSKGDYGLMLPGRNLERSKDGQRDLEVRIKHPSVFRQAVSDSVKAMRFNNMLQMVIDKGLGHTISEFIDLTPRERRAYQVAALDVNQYGTTIDPVSGQSIQPRQQYMYNVLQDFRVRIENGTQPATPQMKRTLDAFLGVKDPKGGWKQEPLVVSYGVSQQLEVLLNDTFRQYGDSMLQRSFDNLNHLLNQWRRNMTIYNPKHWMLARISDVITNHDAGKVSLRDFISSWLFGKGSWYDAASHIDLLQQWTKSGMPKERPDSWTDKQWSDVQQARKAWELMFGSTWTESAITAGMEDYFQGFESKANFQTFMQEQIARMPITDDLQTNLNRALENHAKHFSEGGIARERRALERWGVPNAAQRASAVMDWIAEYQMWEFYAKYAAFVDLKKRNPHMSDEEVALSAAKGTADYRDTSPTLQAWSTNFRILDPRAPKVTVGRGRGELTGAGIALARGMFASPFIMYQQSMTPQKLRNLTANPLAVLTSTVLLQALQATIWSGMDDDERENFNRNKAGRLGQEGEPYITKEDAEHIAKDKLLRISWPYGGSLLSEEQAKKAWPLVVEMLTMSPGQVRAPERRGRAMLSDISDFAGTTATVSNLPRDVRNTMARTSKENAREFYNRLEGLLPSIGFAMAGGLYEATKKQDLAYVMDALTGVAANMNGALRPSPTALFSRPGQRAVESMVFGNQRLKDVFRGTLPGYTDSPADALPELVYSSLWRSQEIKPAGYYQSEGAMVEHLLGVVESKLGIGAVNAMGASSRQKRRAAKAVSDQIAESVVGEYTKYQKWETPPEEVLYAGNRGGVSDSLDARIFLELNVGGDIVPGSEPYELVENPTSTLGKRIAAIGNPTERRFALYSAVEFLRSEAFNGPVRELIMDAAESRQLTPNEFDAMYRASLKNDRGWGVLDLIYRDVKADRNKEARGEQWKVLMHGVEEPKPTNEPAYRQWKFLQEHFSNEPPAEAPVGIFGALPKGKPAGTDIRATRSSRVGRRGLFQELNKDK